MSQSDFVTRGQALVTAGQFQEAVKVCRLGLLGRPTTVEGRVVLGQALLALKRYDEVLAEMRVALELDHTSIPAQVLKGEALLRKGDSHAAIDVFQRVRSLAPTDPRIAQLLAEAERASGRPAMSASHPSVGFVGGSAESMTKHYPNRGPDEEDTGGGTEDTGGSYTRPTSLASNKRSQPHQAMAPAPAVLAVGDKSGTVEVDPELDGVELDGIELGDDELGDVIAPPPTSRGQAGASRSRAKPQPKAKARPRKSEVSSVELLDDELVELVETRQPVEAAAARRKMPGPGTAVRNAVKLPAGPLDVDRRAAAPSPAASRPTAHQPSTAPPPHLAQLIANQPHVMQMNPVPPPQPLPNPPPNPRSAIAAAMPTQAAYQMPPMPGAVAAAARPTIALTSTQQQSAAVVDQLFNGDQPAAPAWARSTVVAGGPAHMGQVGPQQYRIGADEATRQPAPVDPQIASFMGDSSTSGAAAIIGESSQTAGKPLKTGVRKGRSRFQIALWVLIGAVMIGGGVFAGFQIRAMRLGKQITAAREQAVELAKNDTWTGWVGARDRLARIAEASNTPDNRAALARTRALVAFEFSDGLAEAKASVDGLESAGSLDIELALAYLALAQNDGKAAKAAAERAAAVVPSDAAVLYVTGQAALLIGDLKAAISNTKGALEKEPRPLYAVGLARAYAAGSQWDEALAAVAEALKATADHPAALIQKGLLLAESGRIGAGAGPGKEIRTQLDKIVTEGAKPVTEQPRGVSPPQTVLAGLVLARVDFVRGDAAAAQTAIRNALGLSVTLGISDQRLAEEICDTLSAINLATPARKAVDDTLTTWPASRRARATLAMLVLAQNKPSEAVEILGKTQDLDKFPRGLAVRGQAKLAAGDVEGAKADFEAALKKAPKLEAALVGRAWIELAANELDDARKRIEPRYNAAGASIALTTVYAAILRAGADPADRKKAQEILEKAVAGQRGAAVGRAQLELARLQRDLGDLVAARKAYEEAVLGGSWEARVEIGLLQIEDRDPLGGRDTLDALVKEAGAAATPQLLLEAARARMIAGDHVGAEQLLETVDKLQSFERWRYERERGRLALRKSDYPGAALRLSLALDACGDDAETFLLAAEVAGADIKQATLVDKLRQLAPKRLKNRPEAQIVLGKLALAEDKNDEAQKAYIAAQAALGKEKATPRRQAQADFGYAVVLFNKKEDTMAQSPLVLVIERDPSLYSAYLFLAELVREADAKKAFGLAEKAVSFNPDFVEGWVMYGTLAAKLRKRAELAAAVTRVGALSPGSEALRQLQGLR